MKEKLARILDRMDDVMPTESLLPELAVAAVERVMEHGAKKDGRKPEDWKKNADTEYWLSKASGHLDSALGGIHVVDAIDAESGESHLAHAIADLMILLEHELIKEQ